MSDTTLRFGKATIRLQGFEALFKRLNQVGGDARQAAKEVFNAAGPRVLAKSQNLVPVETGALKGSGRFSKARINKRSLVVTASVNYGGGPLERVTGKSPDLRAIMAHERLDVRHARGEAKFLEKPMLAERAAIMKDLQSRIAKEVEKKK